MTGSTIHRIADAAEPEELRWLRGRHRDFYLALAETAAPHLRGPDQRAWLDVLDAEYDNLRAALEWSLEEENADAAMRMTVALGEFWLLRGAWTEARGWVGRAVGLHPDHSALRTKALVVAGGLAFWQGAPEARRIIEETLAAAREMGDVPTEVEALGYLGLLTRNSGGLGEARSILEEALALARVVADPRLVADRLHNLGLTVAYLEGREASRRPLEEALSLYRSAGDLCGIGRVLPPLANNAYVRGDVAAALAYLEESLAIARALKDDVSVAGIFWGLGWRERDRGDYAKARSHFERGAEIYERTATSWGSIWILADLGYVSAEQGDYASAGSAYERALAIARLEDEGACVYLLGALAFIAQAEGDQARADTLLEQMGEMLRATESRGNVGWAMYWRGYIEMLRAQHASARGKLEEALSIFREEGWLHWIQTASWRLGESARARGDYREARARFEERLASARAQAAGPHTFGPALYELGVTARRAGDLERAVALQKEALAGFHLVGTRPWVHRCLDELAALAAAARRPGRAGSLYGAAQALRDLMQTRVQPYDRSTYEAEVAAARARGPNAFDAAWEAGRLLTTSEAIERALADAD